MVVLEKETQKFYAVDFETENMTKLWACLGVLRTESLDRKCGRQMSLHCQDTEKKKDNYFWTALVQNALCHDTI